MESVRDFRLPLNHGNDVEWSHRVTAERVLPGARVRRNRPSDRQEAVSEADRQDPGAGRAGAGDVAGCGREAGRAPEDSATLGLALDRYLEVADLGVSSRATHETYIRRIIRPVLGDVKLREIGPDSLDALYAHLKRCSRLCGRLPKTEHYADDPHTCDERCGPLRDHRTARPHKCDDRCRPHQCTPLAPASIVRVHAIISAALSLAVRYEWIDRNPAERATLPRLRKREPDPPSPKDAARLLNHVWQRRRRVRPVPMGSDDDWRAPWRAARAAGESVRLRRARGRVRQELPGEEGPADREGHQDR